MKKYLFATTAIIGAGAVATSAQAAEGLSLDVGGFANSFYGVSSSDVDGGGAGLDEDRTSTVNDAELHLDGGATFDNGIEVKYSLEVEYGQQTVDADEQTISLIGSFGEFRIGSENSYALEAQEAAWTQGGGIPINTGWFTTMAPDVGGGKGAAAFAFLTPSVSTYMDAHNDAATVEYRSPTIGGFQFGGSWTPASGANAGTFGNVNSDTQQHNAFSIGASFSRDFNGVGISGGGGWITESEADNSPNDDPNWYQGGLKVSAGGFALSGHVGVEDSDRATDGVAYAFHGAYATGPLSFGVDAFISEIEGASIGDGDDETFVLQVGADYAVGPGVSLSAGVLRADYDYDSAVGGATGTETWGAGIGTSVSF